MLRGVTKNRENGIVTPRNTLLHVDFLMRHTRIFQKNLFKNNRLEYKNTVCYTCYTCNTEKILTYDLIRIDCGGICHFCCMVASPPLSVI